MISQFFEEDVQAVAIKGGRAEIEGPLFYPNLPNQPFSLGYRIDTGKKGLTEIRNGKAPAGGKLPGHFGGIVNWYSR
jgi:hypothetical protein